MKFVENNRKVTMGLLTIAVAVAIELLAPKGLTENVKEILEFVAIGFFLSNGVTHIAASLATRVNAPTEPTQPAPVIDDTTLQELKQQNEVLAQGLNGIQQILQTVLRR